MKPNFSQMSTKELRAYVLTHREDLEALDMLVNRCTADSEAIIYPSMFTEDGTPIEENIRIAEEAIRQCIEQENQRKQDFKNKSENLVNFFQNSPLVGVDIDLERQRDFDNRQVEL